MDVLSVKAFAFEIIGKTHKYENCLFALGCLTCFIDKLFAVAVAFDFVALSIGKGLSCFFHSLYKGNGFGRIYVAGACALITELFGQSTDNCHTVCSVQRKK